MPQARMTRDINSLAVQAFAAQANDTYLRRILMVGAVLKGFGGVMEDRPVRKLDRAYLAQALDIIRPYGFHMTQDAQVDVCNLIYGDDFLKGRYEADMVVFCFLYFSTNRFFTRGPQSGRMELDSDIGIYLQSDLAHEKNQWLPALARTGAKVAVNIRQAFRGDDESPELPTRLINGAPYKRVVARAYGQGTHNSPRRHYDVLVLDT